MAQVVGESRIEPTGPAQYAAFLAGAHPEPERIDASTCTLALPLPGDVGIVTSTLSYVLVGPDGVGHIVDPGWDSDDNMARLRGALEEWGIDRVGTVVATHLHPDHLGMVERVRRELGARSVLSRLEWDAVQASVFTRDADRTLEEWGVPAERRAEMRGDYEDPLAGWAGPDELVRDGDVLDLGRPVRVVLTPGHSQGGITLVDETRRRILTGDHVMPHRNPGLGLGYVGDADPVADYYESAERLLEWDGFEVLPGHGYRFGRLGLRVRQHIGHHLRRSRQVAEVHARTPSATIWETAARLHWTAGFESLRHYYLYSALAQTAMHLAFVRDAERSERWLVDPTY